MDVEAEISDLKRRVGDLEGAITLLAAQVRGINPELHGLRSEISSSLERVNLVLARLDDKLDGFLARMGRVELQVWSMRDDLPELIKRALTPEGGGPGPLGS